MLYLVSTPIGNLKDITLRALETLKLCDYLLCEDTRKAHILLKAYQIQKPLIPFHAFCEKRQEKKVLLDLQAGKQIALISDAGTPLICDPGYHLIQQVREQKLPFTILPGACSLISALLLSGFSSERFQFVGFLPKKKGALEKRLKQMICFQGISIAFESPHRIQSTIKALANIYPHGSIAIARELTKIYEECLRGSSQEILQILEQKPLKGEIVLLIEGKNTFSDLPLEEIIPRIQEELGLSWKESLKLAKQLQKKTALI